ncbi:hypothetical protein [Aliiglaciecola litoralis]|uniref:Uncharacterized protein n=1 Tax=Aliiglaciecola litoralis TaxID=582857 RepID=A0ABN1LE54_9ALTE
MSYRISIKDDILHLQFIGHVNGLHVVKVIGDEQFFPNLHKVNFALFDFSAAQEVELSLEEVKSFGTIGKIEANFIDNLHVVIILRNENGRARAEHFINSVGCQNWKFDISLDLPSAFRCINKPNPS